MADGSFPFSTIPDLPPAASVSVDDLIWISQDGVDRSTDLLSVAMVAQGGAVVTSVTSTTSDLSVANPTTTPALTVNAAPRWTTPRNLNFTGDATGAAAIDGSANVSIPLALATVNVNPGTYGDGADVAQITVDLKGRVTAAASVPITRAPKWSTPRTLSFNGDASGASLVDGSADVATTLTLTAVNGNPGAYGDANHVPQFTVDAKGRITGISNLLVPSGLGGTVTNVSSTTGDLSVANPTAQPALTVNSAPKWTAPRNLSFTGDVTGAGAVDGSADVATAMTLAAVNANVGSFGDATHIPRVTVDAKGRVTAASQSGAAVGGTTGFAGPNPAAPTSTTATMAGMGAAPANCTFTPTRSGRVLIMFTGQIVTPVSAPALSGIQVILYYGTGAAPANGAAVTGTAVISPVRGQISAANAATGADYRPFHVCGFVTGLVVGTTYWADLSQALTSASGSGSLNGVNFIFMEQ